MQLFSGIFLDQTINGLVIGNIYALIAIGLALIFGVGNLINFAHGSVYMVGAYVGWFCIARLHINFFLALVFVALVCGFIGLLVERIGLRGIQSQGRIAPLLATIGISFILDQLVQLVFSPNPQAFPNPLPQMRYTLGHVSLGSIDIIIFGVTVSSALALYLFLRHTKMGWAVRATAQDNEAAQQMGVDVNQVNRITFILASVLGGIAGVLVGIYFNTVYPTMSFQAVIKGFAACLLGGLGNIPGAVIGGVVLGLIESFGVAVFGSTYRNLFAFVILIVVLVVYPQGLFGDRKRLLAEPMAGRFITNDVPLRIPGRAIASLIVLALVLPFFIPDPYILQVLINAWLLGMAVISNTLVTGSVGLTHLGQAGFLAIGAYASALLMLRLNLPFGLAILGAAVITSLLGTLLVMPAFRLRGHYVAIVTLAMGEVVNQVILNGDPVTQGAMGIARIPPPSLFGLLVLKPSHVYWYALGLLLFTGLLLWKIMRSPLGRTWRAIREDDVAAQAFGINLLRYKTLAFAVSGFVAGLCGAFTAHLYTFINHETFSNTTSVLVLTAAILGGLGNIFGAVVAALLLTVIPELFRGLVDYRYLFYGLVLILLVRFRPQGLLGTD